MLHVSVCLVACQFTPLQLSGRTGQFQADLTRREESLADAEYLKFYEAGQLEGAIKCDKYYLQK